MLKYIIDAIIICILAIWMANVIDTFRQCAVIAAEKNEVYLESLFEEAGL